MQESKLTPTLPQINLGNSYIKVSRMALGCMGLSSFYTTNSITEEEAIELIGEAIKQGITFFDTAYMYGDNEKTLAKAIKKYGREKFVIATKVPPVFMDENNQFQKLPGDPKNIKKYCQESLDRLEIDYIDLYYQHRIDQNIPIEIQAQAFKDLINEGKVKYYGLSEASEDTIRRAHKVHPVSAIQEEYSLFSREIEENGVLKTCQQLGISLVAYSPLGRGILTGNIQQENLDKNDFRASNPRFQKENFEKNMEKIKELEVIAKDLGITTSQLSLAWLISKGDTVIPIPGTKKLKYLTLNNQAALIKLKPETIKQIEELFPQGSIAGGRYNENEQSMCHSDTPTMEQYEKKS